MKQVIAVWVLAGVVMGVAGCSTPSDYNKACVTGTGQVREACDQPGQSDESKGYQAR